MAAPSRALLSALDRGHEFPPVSIEVSSDAVAAYLDAVQDANGIYRELGLAPPLGVAAAALGALLELLELPAGTLHTGQEIEMRGGVPMGCTCAVRGRIAQRSERAGLVIAALEFEITLAGSREPALVGRTTVMMPKGAGP